MPALAYTPSVQDVANLLRARTRVLAGSEAGTFTDDTVPTDDQVTGLIDTAMAFVAGGLGDVPEGSACEEGARGLAAIKAAQLVEISYYPEQVAPGGTVDQLRALYDELLLAVQNCIGGGVGPDHDTTVGYAAFWDCDEASEPRAAGTQGPYPWPWPWPEWVVKIIDTSGL